MPPRSAERRREALRRLLLVAVTDRGRCRGDPVAACEAAVRGGATAVLLRDRDLPRARRRAIARRLRRITRRYGAALLVHTDAALALAVDADGVHLDSRAGPAEVAAARSLVGKGRLVGVSTHSGEEARRANEAGADYAFFGPVWRSRTHPGRPGTGRGELFRADQEARVPLVAIGGATPARARALAGDHGVAAIDALLGSRDPARAAGEFLGALTVLVGEGARGRRRRGADERSLVAGFLAGMGEVPSLALGPGDDAVVFRDGGFAVATDLTIEGIHYRRGTPARAAGFKAAGRALSDLAAVGAEPLGVMVGLAVPRGGRAPARARGLEAGVAAAAAAAGGRVLGGDTKETAGAETVAVTALGRVAGPPPLSRSGGRPGDVLFVTGPLGGSIRGRHLRPRPRIREGLALRRGGLATACIDLSDGLAADLHRLCRASGVGALLDRRTVPIHADALRLPGRAPFDRALGDGEDYELLFAAPPERAEALLARGVAGRKVHRIGRLVHPAAGVVVQRFEVQRIPDAGWVHFRERPR